MRRLSSGDPASNGKNSDNQSESSKSQTSVPLAEAMRPRDLDSYCGQETAVGPGTQLRSLIESEHIPSLILWGPPGSRPVFLTVEFCLLDSISCLCAVEFLSFYFFLDLNFKVIVA